MPADAETARQRGVYKVPGGKLVAVEFAVAEGRLTGVVVTGDFFLYPEEALPVLAASLEGAPVASGRAALTARVAAGLPSGVELVGASPEALAIAVERALHAPADESAS